MDKQQILKQLEDKVRADLAVLTQAALHAREAAIHAESKAEDQYDTRGLEASYLAGAQSKRVLELQRLCDLYHYLDIQDFTSTSPIAATALIELFHDGKSAFFFLLPDGGGLGAVFEGKSIQVITPKAPLGGAVLGRVVGDEFSVRIAGTEKDYEIARVW